MAQLEFNVRNQSITRVDRFRVVAQSRNYLYAQFRFFTDDWGGTDKIAIFQKGDTSYKIALDENGVCLVPWEQLTTAGEIRVSIYGGTPEKLITVNTAAVKVFDTGYTDSAGDGTEPTPDVIVTILDDLRSTESAVGTLSETSAALSGRMDALETDSENAAQALTALAERTGDTETMVADHGSRITALETADADISTRLTAAESGISDLSTSGANMGADIATLQGQLNSLPSAFYSNGLFLSNSVDNAVGVHNSIYRGKNLGTSFTAEQSAEISSGRFTDLFIGDYWTLNGRIYRIACFDPAFNCGDAGGVGAITASNKHHIAVVPDACLYNAQMHNTQSGAYESGNTANTTAGGYVGSDMKTTNLAQATTTIEGDFGSAHVLSYRDILTNNVGTYQSIANVASGWAWTDCRVELMSETMVWGTKFWAPSTLEGGIMAFQLPLFRLNPRLIHTRYSYWLRGVSSATAFANVTNYGYPANYYGASNVYGVRPLALIY